VIAKLIRCPFSRESARWVIESDLKPLGKPRESGVRAVGIRDTNIPSADLARADLRDADLSGANLSGGTDLTCADLSRANLNSATAKHKQLDVACGEDAKLPPGMTLKPCPESDEW